MTKAERIARKNAQIATNNEVEKVVNNAMDIWHKNNHGKGKRLNSMKAWVFQIGSIKYLVSYETLVAVIVNGKGYDFMRMQYFYKEWVIYNPFWGYIDKSESTNYSPTTARQIATFFNQQKVQEVLTYRDI